MCQVRMAAVPTEPLAASDTLARLESPPLRHAAAPVIEPCTGPHRSKRARPSSVSWGSVQEYRFASTLDASKVAISDGPPIGLGLLQSVRYHRNIESFDEQRNAVPEAARCVRSIPADERIAACALRRIESIEQELMSQEATRRGRIETVNEVYAEEFAARNAKRERRQVFEQEAGLFGVACGPGFSSSRCAAVAPAPAASAPPYAPQLDESAPSLCDIWC